ncbi:5-carboxymethyl-2-hydroxymuconate Delta-isomerase [Aliikangiella coralliicola]|uniref:5-carboxymethyl-2-hydroxymuconate Delta-isomerase n=1 Tax=Aliikangiella coralliicola TaxID=2592383 RepID=A0A545UIZ4_9GAMM|nr:5-carboxymethyl-2-hydroxymuconate Delta-isomerase [Aliikangiella coralliicola]TQV89436.1 5-carboxymethyl-2-hydroxymuconate Delta-isomerase [Aliikangiella coralliicola]
MPHCIIEFATELEERINITTLIDSVHQGALLSELFEEKDIKTRAIAIDYFRTGIEKQPFIHVTVKILSGRSAEQRAALSNSIAHELRKLKISQISLTIEICEIEKSSYVKILTDG